MGLDATEFRAHVKLIDWDTFVGYQFIWQPPQDVTLVLVHVQDDSTRLFSRPKTEQWFAVVTCRGWDQMDIQFQSHLDEVIPEIVMPVCPSVRKVWSLVNIGEGGLHDFCCLLLSNQDATKLLMLLS